MATVRLRPMFSMIRRCSCAVRPTIHRSYSDKKSEFREVQQTEDGDVTVIEGVFKDVGVNILEVPGASDACPLCSRNIHVNYTDVLILSQFVRSDGSVLPRRITGLCRRQQRHVEKCIDQAQKEGLLPRPSLGNMKKPPQDLKLPKGIFHTYYVKEKDVKKF